MGIDDKEIVPRCGRSPDVGEEESRRLRSCGFTRIWAVAWWSRAKRFFELPWPERVRVALYALGFPLIAVALRVWQYKTLKARLGAVSGPTRRHRHRKSLPAQRIAELVEMSSRGSLWKPDCLQRSMLLWWALRAEGWESEIRFGVRKRSGGAGFDFHAWVERNGEVINDHPSIDETFMPLVASADLPPEARLV